VIGLLRLFLRIFFRRIELAGLERVPPTGPLLVVLNHPNGLIDPLFVLCLAPRRVAFLAKAPLFRMPVLGWVIRGLGSIPVNRPRDPGADPARNREMFVRARKHLGGGGAIALFPEGTSHSDPKLKPLKTGAARIALGVPAATPLQIVAAGLHYTAKQTFRSEALVVFGEPFAVEPAPLDESGEPPEAAVDALTARIGAALAAVTLQAEAIEAQDLAARAERILASGARRDDDAPRPDLREGFELRRRLLAGYEALLARQPDRLARLRTRILNYEWRLRGAGIDPWELPVGGIPTDRAVLHGLLFLLRLLVLLPLGIPGLVLNYLPYRAVAIVSARVAGRDVDVLASVKAIAAFLLFPATWTLAALFAGRGWGAAAGWIVAGLAPASGWAALRLGEVWERAIGAGRALLLRLVGRNQFEHLQAERLAIRAEVVALANELGV